MPTPEVCKLTFDEIPPIEKFGKKGIIIMKLTENPLGKDNV